MGSAGRFLQAHPRGSSHARAAAAVHLHRRVLGGVDRADARAADVLRGPGRPQLVRPRRPVPVRSRHDREPDHEPIRRGRRGPRGGARHNLLDGVRSWRGPWVGRPAQRRVRHRPSDERVRDFRCSGACAAGRCHPDAAAGGTPPERHRTRAPATERRRVPDHAGRGLLLGRRPRRQRCGRRRRRRVPGVHEREVHEDDVQLLLRGPRVPSFRLAGRRLQGHAGEGDPGAVLPPAPAAEGYLFRGRCQWPRGGVFPRSPRLGADGDRR
mmetsp:Transcript_62404/g.175994  ORF Transcript_62404/g.175994 Transcript_62404/m.175994 type:complete len:268 (+) Transcript_62404:1544-2347(+)